MDAKERKSTIFECMILPDGEKSATSVDQTTSTEISTTEVNSRPPPLIQIQGQLNDGELYIKEEVSEPPPDMQTDPNELQADPHELQADPHDQAVVTSDAEVITDIEVAATLRQHQESWLANKDTDDEEPINLVTEQNHRETEAGTHINGPLLLEQLSPQVEDLSSAPQHDEPTPNDNYSLFYCEVCLQSFQISEDLQSHMIAAHCNIQPQVILQRLSCRKCPETFPDRKSLSVHTATHRARPRCPECDQKFKNLARLKSHMRCHKRQPKPPQQDLEMTCERPGEVTGPKFKHKNYVCKVCGLKLKSKTKMMAHLFAEHCDELSASDSELEIPCDLCDFRATSQASLTEHSTTHPKCGVCDVVVVSKDALQKHMTTHNNQEVVETVGTIEPAKAEPECILEDTNDDNDNNDDFYDDNNYDDDDDGLSDHFEFNDLGGKVKPATLTEQDMKEGTLITWQKLILRRNLACNFCCLSFPSRMSLYGHAENIHGSINNPVKFSSRAKDDNGSYRCDLCVRSFQNYSALIDHKLRHRGILPYACKFCTKIYADRRNLAFHCDKDHPNALAIALRDAEKPKDEVPVPLKRLRNPDSITPTEEDRRSHKIGILICPLCKIRFKNLYLLYKHCITSHMDRMITPRTKQKSTSGSYKCAMCGVGFGTLDHMRLHMVRHFNIKPYMCKFCGHLYANRCGIQIHMAQSHSKKKDGPRTRAARLKERTIKASSKAAICDFCQFKAARKSVIRGHILQNHLQDSQTTKHGVAIKQKEIDGELESLITADFYPHKSTKEEEPLTCHFCGMIYHRKHLLMFHIQEMHHGNTNMKQKSKKLVCKKCNKQFKHRYELKEHELVYHQGIKPYTCHYCVNVSFNNRGSLYMHRKLYHPREFAQRRRRNKPEAPVKIIPPIPVESATKPEEILKNFTCSICEKVLKGKESLTNHIMVHLNIPFKCKYCPTKFKQANKLKNHFCSVKKYPFLCTCCGRRFKLKHKLLIHRSTHPKTNVCDICGKGFINISCLTRHMAVYHEAPQLLCPECGAMFSLQTQLDRHLRNHKEMKHVCPDCPRKFWDIRQLQQHRNMEHKEKRYICELCGRALSQKWHYEAHMSSHKGERNFGCDECGKKYTSRNALKYHNTTRHPELAKQKKIIPAKRQRKSNKPPVPQQQDFSMFQNQLFNNPNIPQLSTINFQHLQPAVQQHHHTNMHPAHSNNTFFSL